jgi:hypothetical protein
MADSDFENNPREQVEHFALCAEKALVELKDIATLLAQDEIRSHMFLDRLDVPRTLEGYNDKILTVSDRILWLGAKIQEAKAK